MNSSTLIHLVAHLSKHLKKPILFAIFGATGCLLGAVFGEVLAQAFANLRGAQIAMLIDCSGSMSQNNRMEEAKQAATAFVQRTDFARDTIGLVIFSAKAAEMVPPTTSAADLVNAISRLYPLQSTAMDAGLAEAARQLGRSAPDADQLRAILLFTDGVPDNVADTIATAESVRGAGIRIVAVATGDANLDVLRTITGNTNQVFFASQGGFDNAFRKAETALRRPQLIGSGGGEYSLGASLLRNVGWAVFVAVGLALLLTAGQNAYLRRAPFNSQALPSILAGSVFAGLIAGVAAQVGLQVISGAHANASLADWCRVPAWAALGALLGRGMAGVVPNLKRQAAMKGGAVGGAVAGAVLLAVTTAVGDGAARFIGAAILGAFVGYGIALVEELAREASLIVHWGPNENTVLSLGSDPVILGSSREAHVYLAAEKGFPPVAGLVSFGNGQVQFENRMNSQNYTLRDGSKLQLSNVTLEVKTA